MIWKADGSDSQGGYSGSDRLEIVDPGASGEAVFRRNLGHRPYPAQKPVQRGGEEKNHDHPIPKMQEGFRKL